MREIAEIAEIAGKIADRNPPLNGTKKIVKSIKNKYIRRFLIEDLKQIQWPIP